jgi:hypothetical protein
MSTTYSVATAKADSSSAANFKTWAQPISDALSSSQFNWSPAFSGSTVGGASGNGTRLTWASVSSVPTTTGDLFEVWGMNDGATQSSCPFYLRIDYFWNGSQNITGISAGRGYNTSNGALTGTNGETLNMYTLSDGGGVTTYTHYFSGGTSHFRWNLFNGKASDQSFLIVERSKDSTGADTTSFVAVAMCSQQYSTKHFLVPQAGTPLASTTRWPVPYYEPTTALFGVDMAVFPYLPTHITVGAPLLGMGVVKAADVTTQNGNNISVTHYGSSHTYKVLGDPSFSRAMYDVNDCRILMRYE